MIRPNLPPVDVLNQFEGFLRTGGGIAGAETLEDSETRFALLTDGTARGVLQSKHGRVAPRSCSSIIWNFRHLALVH